MWRISSSGLNSRSAETRSSPSIRYLPSILDIPVSGRVAIRHLGEVIALDLRLAGVRPAVHPLQGKSRTSSARTQVIRAEIRSTSVKSDPTCARVAIGLGLHAFAFGEGLTVFGSRFGVRYLNECFSIHKDNVPRKMDVTPTCRVIESGSCAAAVHTLRALTAGPVARETPPARIGAPPVRGKGDDSHPNVVRRTFRRTFFQPAIQRTSGVIRRKASCPDGSHPGPPSTI
jgi:hypothetical protein